MTDASGDTQVFFLHITIDQKFPELFIADRHYYHLKSNLQSLLKSQETMRRFQRTLISILVYHKFPVISSSYASIFTVALSTN
jgi:hypothetical protein